MSGSLDGSVFGATDAADYDTGAVTFVFNEDEDIAGLKMDAAKSADHFAELVGSAVYDMGKCVVGRVTAVEADLRTHKVYVETSITDATALAKLRHGVFHGAQARSNAVAKTAAAYTAVPGSLNLVDVPFDNSTALHKRMSRTATLADPANALMKALGLPPIPRGELIAKRQLSDDLLADFVAALRGLEVAMAKFDAVEGPEAMVSAWLRKNADSLDVRRRPGGVAIPALEPVTTYAGLRWADEPVRKIHG